jgi:hypothetical protein
MSASGEYRPPPGAPSVVGHSAVRPAAAVAQNKTAAGMKFTTEDTEAQRNALCPLCTSVVKKIFLTPAG